MKESGRRDSFRYLSHAYNTRVVPLLILFARVVLLPRFAILQLKPLMIRVLSQIDHRFVIKQFLFDSFYHFFIFR